MRQMTSTVTYICVFVLATSVCLSGVSKAYIDCSMECLFAKFRQPTVCECNYNVKSHWGKRAPRTQTHSGLPTFRYGKRAAFFDDSDLEEKDRFDELSAIQDEFYPGLDTRK
ncbi:uncharacterized protein LOC127860937 isoform X2 [Dreissena polymorpha]|uniref:uncharacterized protein LOC127860937 isoform X2 n=1 Tax=Dreissena polymorpha TaxID=45954 RepID=UPI002264F2C8|nr:uncharacterized protein LOC127860937 isoform X2 [Dreissena polymorpha]